MITYNHVNYIRQAIEGVLMQNVDFTWELIIADDCSTDGTREILLEYKRKYPDFIKLILQEKNVGPRQNWFDLINAPLSKYIAYFEGDDYWTDPLKLQKQVTFLESNSNYSFCCTNYSTKSEDTGKIEPIQMIESCFKHSAKNYQITHDNFIDPYVLKLGTIVYRQSIWLKQREALSKFNCFSDVFFFAMLLTEGFGTLFNDSTTVRRVHIGGTWSLKPDTYHALENLNLFREMKYFYND
ncbi:MAG: glycosyltransferase, partial [Bacteroidetes bacterium]|nr:glycosyltransferase [Bacteroidota bacterium]